MRAGTASELLTLSTVSVQMREAGSTVSLCWD